MAAKIEKFKLAKGHQRYYTADGTWVPGVTTITGMLDKPALKYWANDLGFKNINVRTYVDILAKVGTCAHTMVEADFLGLEPDLSEFSPKEVDLAENGFLKYLEWRKGKKIKPIANELRMVSERLRCGGTTDIICELDDILTLADVKTSSGIYPESEMQASTYADIARENGHDIKRVIILNIPRSDDENFLEPEVKPADQKLFVEMFEHLRKAYATKKALNWDKRRIK